MALPTVKADFYAIRVYFGEALHLSLRRADLWAVQSWVESAERACIEFTSVTGASVTCEYEDPAIFGHLLAELDKVLHARR
jgi:hypothetical protein